MKLQNIAVALGVAGLGLAQQVTVAQALDFNWSFQTAVSPVTGTISGLQEGLTTDLSGVIVNVTSAPTQRLVGGGWSFYPDPNYSTPVFIVEAGNVTYSNALFVRQDPENSLYQNNLYFGSPGIPSPLPTNNLYTPEISVPETFTDGGPEVRFTGGNLVFTPVTAVPESNQGIIALGLPLFLGLRILKNSQTKSFS